MTTDKRDPNFAYLRHNLFASKSKGLYPSVDFKQDYPTSLSSTDILRDIIGTEQDGYDRKVIIDVGSNLEIYDVGSDVLKKTMVGKSYDCGCFGEDGIHIIVDNTDVYRLEHVNNNVTSIGTLPSGDNPIIAINDGLYYWYLSPTEIYKQLDDGSPTIAFNDVGATPLFADVYNDQLVIFTQKGNSINVFFWDKSDTDLFQKRITINNANIISGGVVDGRLMLVKSVGNSSNTKERNGEIVVTAFDGEKFERLNSIKAGNKAVTYMDVKSSDTGNEVMVVALKSNKDTHNETLFQNYVLKIRNNGNIETLYIPDDTVHGDIEIVRVTYNYIILGMQHEGSFAPMLFTNELNDDDYGDYQDFNDSVYVTEFLNNPFNKHKLDSFSVAFEKLFSPVTANTGEKLVVSYRVSERDDFTELLTITSEDVKDDIDARMSQTDKDSNYNDDTVGLRNQIYTITKLPDGSPLPQYNEIQFKYESYKGFSVIGSWYRYEYLTRNTI